MSGNMGSFYIHEQYANAPLTFTCGTEHSELYNPYMQCTTIYTGNRLTAGSRALHVVLDSWLFMERAYNIWVGRYSMNDDVHTVYMYGYIPKHNVAITILVTSLTRDSKSLGHYLCGVYCLLYWLTRCTCSLVTLARICTCA